MNTCLPAIETENLCVAYAETTVLQSVDLVIPAGIVMGLAGPNGAGKTTLLKAILDLVPACAGEIRLFGKPLSANRMQVAYVPQRSAIDWDFPVNVHDFVMMGTYGRLGWIRRPGEREKQQVATALQRLGMTEHADRQIGELSGGQQQRTFLARAFVQDAAVCLLDEPFVGVDVPTEQTIVGLLHEMRDAGKTIVVVQHDLKTVESYFDHITFVNRRIVACGPVAETFTDANIEATYHTVF